MLEIFQDELGKASSFDLLTVVLNEKQIDMTVGEFNGLFDSAGYTVMPKEGLRLRNKPTTSGKILIVIPQNSGVILMSNQIVLANGYHWLNVKYAGVTGYVAAEYLSSAPLPTSNLDKRFGLHVYPQTGADGAGNEALYATAERLYNSKRPMSFTVLEPSQANRLMPYAKYLVFRPYIKEHFNISNNSSEAQSQGMNWVYQHIDLLNGLNVNSNVYIQMTNEGDNCDTKHVNFGWFNLGVMLALENIGRKGVIFNDSVGTPELTDIANRTQAINYARKFGHLIGYHGYSKPDGSNDCDASDTNPDNQKWFSHRYKWLYPNDVKIIINEAGRFHARFLNVENTVNDMKKYNSQLADNVVAVNWWQYNGRGSNWNHSVLNEALPSIEQMIKTV